MSAFTKLDPWYESTAAPPCNQLAIKYIYLIEKQTLMAITSSRETWYQLLGMSGLNPCNCAKSMKNFFLLAGSNHFPKSSITSSIPRNKHTNCNELDWLQVDFGEQMDQTLNNACIIKCHELIQSLKLNQFNPASKWNTFIERNSFLVRAYQFAGMRGSNPSLFAKSVYTFLRLSTDAQKASKQSISYYQESGLCIQGRTVNLSLSRPISGNTVIKVRMRPPFTFINTDAPPWEIINQNTRGEGTLPSLSQFQFWKYCTMSREAEDLSRDPSRISRKMFSCSFPYQKSRIQRALVCI